MKIAFLDRPGMTYTPATPYERPLGGTQSAACYLSAALAERGHQVTLLSDGTHREQVMGVNCVGTSSVRLRDVLNDQDLVIVLTVPVGVKFDRIEVRTPRILWQHLAADHGTVQPHYLEPERSSWDAVVYVSEHQRAGHIARGGRDGTVILNGASPVFIRDEPLRPSFVDRGEPPRLAFSSAPGRGLDFLLTAFPALRRLHPGLTLSICSDLSLYQADGEEDLFPIYYDWARALEGVDYLGAQSQPALAEVLRGCDIWAFPSRVTESSCIAMMEAGLAGCRLVACDLGALGETSGGHAKLIPLVAHRLAWVDAFIRAVSEDIEAARSDPEAADQHRQDAYRWFATSCDWKAKAAQWEAFAEPLIGKTR